MSNLLLENAVLEQVAYASHLNTGLLIGQSDGTNTYALYAVPTPLGSSDSKLTSWTTAHSNWVKVHSAQVQRMLCGGLDVVGLYGTGDGASTLGKVGAVHSCLQSVGSAENRFLLSIPGQGGKAIATRVSLESGKWVAPRVVPFKTQSFLKKLHSVESSIALDSLDVFTGAAETGVSVNDKVSAAVKGVAVSLSKAAVQIDGKFVTDASPIEKSFGSSSGHTARILTSISKPVSALPSIDAAGQVNAVSITGSLPLRVFAVHKAPSTSLVEYLRNDVERSIQSCIKILEEEYEDDGGEGSPFDANGTTSNGEWALPQRVFIKTQAGILFCDYMTAHDTLQDVAERNGELLGLQLTSDDIIQLGDLPQTGPRSVLGATPASTGTSPTPTTPTSSGAVKPAEGMSPVVLLSIVIATVSAVFGFLLLR